MFGMSKKSKNRMDTARIELATFHKHDEFHLCEAKIIPLDHAPF